MSNLKNIKQKGRVFVVSAPSGAGKTTLCRRILDKFDFLSYSISHTTRLPRNGEENGVDYFFITKDEFEEKIRSGFWAEWANVHDNLYGTSLEFIKEKIQNGSSLLLDIDVQGAKQIKAAIPDAITIFIMPPSFEILEQRLRARGTDSEEVIQKRLVNAEKEINAKEFYDFSIVNDDLDKAVEEFAEIIEGACACNELERK